MDISGWLIEDHSDRSVKITHIAQLDVKERIKPFIYKILVSELAKAPRAVAEFIDDAGYAPFFVRWGEGPAQLVGDSDGDLKIAKSVFRVNGAGEGTMANGQQKCWLQYSDKMYERGVDVIVKPASACTIGRVEGLPRTLEFTWTEEVKEGATITLIGARGDGAEDVFVDGRFLDRVVAMETPAANGSGAGMSRRKAPRKEAVVAAAAPIAAVAMAKRQSNGYTAEKPTKVRSLPLHLSCFADRAFYSSLPSPTATRPPRPLPSLLPLVPLPLKSPLPPPRKFRLSQRRTTRATPRTPVSSSLPISTSLDRKSSLWRSFSSERGVSERSSNSLSLSALLSVIQSLFSFLFRARI